MEDNQMSEVKLEGVYAPSEDIVAREIEGEILIVPLVSGMGDMEDDLFNLNKTGETIWKNLDGKNSLREIVEKISEEFEAPAGEIEKDVLGFVEELLKRQIIVEIPKN
jgi:hypothetical protein